MHSAPHSTQVITVFIFSTILIVGDLRRSTAVRGRTGQRLDTVSTRRRVDPYRFDCTVAKQDRRAIGRQIALLGGT